VLAHTSLSVLYQKKGRFLRPKPRGRGAGVGMEAAVEEELAISYQLQLQIRSTAGFFSDQADS